MGYYDNPMHNPQDYDVEVIGEVYLSEPDYSFDLLGVLRGKDGYYLGTDSGCSCPSPWESHTMDDFTGPLTAEQAREEATSLNGGAYGDEPFEPEEFAELLAKIV